MPPDSAQERTEPPTARRRREARSQGQVARSNDLGAAATLLGGLIALYYMGGRIILQTVAAMQRCFGATDDDLLRPESMAALTLTVMKSVGATLLPLLIAVVAAGVAVQALQVGWFPTLRPITPSLAKLNPLTGIKRLFSTRTAARTAISLAKFLIVSAVAYTTIRSRYGMLVAGMGLHDWGIALLLADLMFTMSLRMAIVLLLLGIVDYIYERYKNEESLKMTKQEVQDELKSMEGDPKIKQRRRQVQVQLMLQRIKSAVPKADVVVTNPTELAVALQYDESKMTAPKVVAKGQGYVAQRIREIAIEHGIPIIERKPLAQALYRWVEVGQEIPPQFYRAVAEILAYVYELAGKGYRRSATPAGAGIQ